jgi:hypothetical protein
VSAPTPPIVRRRVVAAGGVYASAALGIAGTLIAYRVLGPTQAGRFAIVLGVVQFLALLIELTSAEALVKYGFRYRRARDWPRFHPVVRLTFAFEVASCSSRPRWSSPRAVRRLVFSEAGSPAVPPVAAPRRSCSRWSRWARSC